MNKNIEPTFVDLFSGCGGLSLGFLQAGFRCLIAIDNNPTAVHCYNYNLRNKSEYGAVLTDLSKFKSKQDVIEFLRKYSIEPYSCDVLVGGPPCQSFSVVGRNKIRALMDSDGDLKAFWYRKNEERSMLFDVYAMFLEVLNPRWFLFENVPAIRSHKMFGCILKRFNNLRSHHRDYLEYLLAPDIHIASQFGVPQDRKRFTIVGHRRDINIGNWRGPVEKPAVSVAEALDDLPEVSHGHLERTMRYGSSPSTPYQRLMRSQKKVGTWGKVFDHICRWHNQDDLALFAQMEAGARFADPEVQRIIRQINPDHKLIKYSTEKFKDKLHKLDPERPAWTVTAHLQKDCYKFIHHRQPRTITVREAARLQSFPDWFRFDGISMVNSFGLIGNAVPPLFAQAFATSFLACDCELNIRFKNSEKVISEAV